MGKFFTATDSIDFSVREHVARITLNRPDKRNALTPPMIESLHDALIEADARTLQRLAAESDARAQSAAKRCIALAVADTPAGFDLERELGGALLESPRTQALITAFLERNAARP